MRNDSELTEMTPTTESEQRITLAYFRIRAERDELRYRSTGKLR